MKCPGLCLRVQPSGHRAFKFVYSHNGKPRWFHLGQVHLADARRLAAKLRVAVIEGGDPHGERRCAADNFQEVADRYLEEHAKKQNKSWRGARRLIERFALPIWADRSIKSITRGDIKSVIARVKAPVLANSTLSGLSAIFSWALRESLVEANPCRGMTKNPVRSRERVATDDEIRRLWAVFAGTDTVESAVLRVALLCGQRSSEILHMRHQDIERSGDGAWWNLPGNAEKDWPGRKSGNSHRVWLTPLTLSILPGSILPRYVFGTKGLRLDRTMHYACETAGISSPPLRPHDLRRTFATLVARYFGRAPVSRVLGHADHSIAAVYDRHGYDAENKIIWEKISAHVMAITNSGEQPRVLDCAHPLVDIAD